MEIQRKIKNIFKKVLTTSIIATCIYSGGVFALNSPIVSSFWANQNLSQKACIAKASVSVKATGFTKRFAVQNDKIFGVSGDNTNTGAITCIASKGLVLFSVAGSSGKVTYPLSQKLLKNFQK